MPVAMRRRKRNDRHAADGIQRFVRRRPGTRRMLRRLRVVVARVRHDGFLRLAGDTPRGDLAGMQKDIKASCLKRLKRIEGQVRGLGRMVEEDRYCIDVVTQIAAARAALRRLEEAVLRDHVGHCVEHAIRSGDKADQRRKIAELMAVVSRAER
jgi:DNA-binding FrmR family transcriptional regulator